MRSGMDDSEARADALLAERKITGAQQRAACVTLAADAAARAVDAALAAMPPRPQSPDHRMPPEVAWQRWSGDVDGGPPFTTPPGGTRRQYDPCGAPPLKSGEAT